MNEMKLKQQRTQEEGRKREAIIGIVGVGDIDAIC